MKGLIVKPLKDSFEPPRRPPNDLPPIGAGKYHAALFIGAMGGGKTTALLTLLRAYASTGSYDYIWYVSRTVDYDKKVLDVLSGIRDLKTETFGDDFSLGAIISRIKDIDEEYKKHLLYVKAWHVFQRTPEDRLDSIPEDQMRLLEDGGFMPPDPKLFPRGAPIHALVLDDMLGHSVLSTKNSSPLNKLLAIHRHLRVNIYIGLQAFSQSLSPALRAAMNMFCLWRCKSERVKETIASSLSGHLSSQEFINMWDKATAGDPHDFFCVMLHSPRPYRKTFSEVISDGAR